LLFPSTASLCRVPQTASRHSGIGPLTLEAPEPTAEMPSSLSANRTGRTSPITRNTWPITCRRGGLQPLKASGARMSTVQTHAEAGSAGRVAGTAEPLATDFGPATEAQQVAEHHLESLARERAQWMLQTALQEKVAVYMGRRRTTARASRAPTPGRSGCVSSKVAPSANRLEGQCALICEALRPFDSMCVT